MKLLLLSNSTNSDSEYLGHAWEEIEDFLAGVSELLFVPYAAKNHDEYTRIPAEAFAKHGISVRGLHEYEDPKAAIRDAQAIFVGGGNTFRLLATLQTKQLIGPLREHVASDRPYMGASAGTNMAAPTLKTTNDMPIVEPLDFNALALLPFQLNCHYLDSDPTSKHAGETREVRLAEYLEEKDVPVLALREGTHLRVDSANNGTTPSVRIGGAAVNKTKGPAVLFRQGQDPAEVSGDVSELFKDPDSEQ